MRRGIDPLTLQEIRRVEADVASARARIARAATLRDVVEASRVTPRSPFQFLKHLVPDLRSLPAFAEQRAEALVRGHLASIEQAVTPDACRELHGRFTAGEWRLLPGNFPRLARLVQEAGPRLLKAAEARVRETP